VAQARQHTVSAFLLDRFASETKRGRRVAMLDKRSGTPKLVSPRDAAVRRHFYSIDVEGGRNPGVEEVLSQIETVAAPLVRGLDEEKLTVGQQRLELALFLGVCLLRTPKRREQTASVFEQATAEMAKVSYERDPEIAQRAFADSDMTPEEIEAFRKEFVEDLAKGRLAVTFPKNLMIRYFLEGVMSASWMLFLLDWTLVRLDHTHDEFVIADNPFSLFDPTPAFPGGGHGLISSPNAQAFIPLAPRMGVFVHASDEVWEWARENLESFHDMNDDERLEVVRDREGGWAGATPTSEFGRELNLRSYANAERFIFGSQQAVQNVRAQSKANAPRVATLTQTGEPRLHIVEDDDSTGGLRITQTFAPER
jgi:hypothetical protein